MKDIREVEFRIVYDGDCWVVRDNNAGTGEPIAHGITPVGAMINAEIALRKQPR